MPKRKASPKKKNTEDPKRKLASTNIQQNDSAVATGGLCSVPTPGPSGISNSNEEESLEAFLARMKARNRKEKSLQFQTPEPSSSVPEDPQDPDVKRRMDFIDENRKKCEEVIALMDKLVPATATDGNPKTWREQLDQLKPRLTLPTTTIAVIGATGVGKSSLLNALIGFRDLLPTSDTQSCTAVVVQVTMNSASNNFEADIEFLSKEAWEEEVNQLLSDLEVKDDPGTEEELDTEREIINDASRKLEAVYGEIQPSTTLQELQMRDNEVVKHLGRPEEITTETLEEFKEKIHPFIKSGKDAGYWPIIKQVNIRIPDCGVCCSGATLVDLPGGNDTNGAREKTAKEFLKNCDAVWVVSGSERAVSDQTGWKMLNSDLRRQLLMDGKYGSLAFVCTKTDTLDDTNMDSDIEVPAEVVNLEEEINETDKENEVLKKDIAKLDTEIKQLEDINSEKANDKARLLAISQEQFPDEDLQGMLKNLSSEERGRKKQIEKKQGQKKTKEAQAYELEQKLTGKRKRACFLRREKRNLFISKNIKSNFKKSHLELLKKTMDAKDEVLDRTMNILPVYCVSAAQYLMMKTNVNKHKQTFSNTEETQVPALKNFVHDITTQRRQQEVKKLMRATGAFVSNVQGDLLTELTPVSGTQIEKIKKKLDQHKEGLEKELEKAVEKVEGELEKILCDKLEPSLREGVEKAIEAAGGIQNKWADVSIGGYKWITYKATCRREGEFKRRGGEARKINFNMDLCRPIYNSIAEPWGGIFTVHGLQFTPSNVLSPVPAASIMKFLKQFKKDVLESVEEYFRSRSKDSSLVYTVAYIKFVNQQGKNNVISELDDTIDIVWEYIQEKQKDTNRNLMEEVKRGMLPAYSYCMNQRRRGMFKKMKRHMERHVLENKNDIFKRASDVLEHELKSMQEKCIEELRESLRVVVNKLGMTDVSLGDRRQTLQKRFKQVQHCSDLVRQMFESAGITDMQMLQVPSSSSYNQM